MGTLGIILSILGGLGIAAGIGSSFGASANARKSEKEVRSQDAIIEKQHADQEAWFNKQYYQDITDRTDVQNMLRQLAEQEETSRKRDEAAASVMGATDEAKLAMADSRNKRRADAIADIASNSSMLKDQYLKDWQKRLDDYYGQKIGMSDKIAGIYQNKSNQWAQAATNAYKTGFNLLGQYKPEV